MKNTHISVITPIYNAENFVERGMTCLLNQGFQDLEIIAVNDGSTDRSGGILDSLAKSDSRLRVIHKKNEGVGKARNDGMRYAQGDYIYFMDIDDLLDLNFFEKALHLLSHHDAPDLLMFGFNVVDNGVLETVQIADKYIAGKEELSSCYTQDFFKVRHGSGFLWNKLYKRSIIEDNHILFGTYRVQEDELFNIEYMKHVETACLCNRPYYTYFLNNGGNSRSKYLPNMLEILESVHTSFLDLKECLEINDSEFLAHLNNRTFSAIMGWCRQHAFHLDNTMGYAEKRKQLGILRETAIWKQASGYVSCNPMPIEYRLYTHAIQAASVVQLRVYVSIYTFIRTILNKIRHA